MEHYHHQQQHQQQQQQQQQSCQARKQQQQHRDRNHPMVQITLQSLHGFGIKLHSNSNSSHSGSSNNNPRIPKVTAAVAFTGSAADMEIGSSFVCPKTGRLMVESHAATTQPRRQQTSTGTSGRTGTGTNATTTSKDAASQPLVAHWNHSSRTNGGPLDEYNTASTAISLFHNSHYSNHADDDHDDSPFGSAADHGAAPHASIYLPPQDPRLPAMPIAVSNRDSKVLHQSTSKESHHNNTKNNTNTNSTCDASSIIVNTGTMTTTTAINTVPSLMAHSDVSSTYPAASSDASEVTNHTINNVKHIDDIDLEDDDPVATAIWNASPDAGAVMPEIIEMHVSIRVDSEGLRRHGNQYNNKKKKQQRNNGNDAAALDRSARSRARSESASSHSHQDALDQSGRSNRTGSGGVGGGLRDLLDRSIKSVRSIAQSSSASTSPTTSNGAAKKGFLVEDVNGDSYDTDHDEDDRDATDDDDAHDYADNPTTNIDEDDDNVLQMTAETQSMYQVGLAYLVLFGNDGGSTLMDLPIKKLAAQNTSSSSSSALDELVVLYPDASLRVRVDVYPTGKKPSPPPPTLYTSISILEQATQLHQSNVLEPILKQLQLAEEFKAQRRHDRNNNKNQGSLVELERPYGRLAATAGPSSFLCGVMDMLSRCDDRTDDDDDDNDDHNYNHNKDQLLMDGAYSMDSTLDTSPSMRLW